MKILIIGSRGRYEKFSPEHISDSSHEIVFFPREAGEKDLIAGAKDAEIILVDAITPVSRALIGQMPRLKMIHSEGVAYDKIDLAAADERGIFVCNNKGCNAAAVAEQAILLMLAWLRSTIAGDRAVREGHQIEMKERKMIEGITELGDCAIGLIGFGGIAKAAALRLKAFGSAVYYYAPHRRSKEEEENFGVQYVELDKLAEIADIVSIHAAVTPQTRGMINAAFLQKMKPSAFIVNTARGEIADNAALREALITGTIAGAAFDTLYPEPTPKDHPLVDLPDNCRDKVVFAPHLGGITTSSFKRAHHDMWNNVTRLARGEKPANIVNGGSVSGVSTSATNC
jgi:phosphoglycerate dehydrogenase-like enzyme